MVGRFALAIFITVVSALVRMFWVIEHVSLMIDLDRILHGPVCQAANGARYQERFTGYENPAAKIFITDGPQGDGQQLVRSQGIIGDSLSGRLPGRPVEAVGEKPRAITPEQV